MYDVWPISPVLRVPQRHHLALHPLISDNFIKQ